MLNLFSDEVQAHLANCHAKVFYMNENFKERMKRLRLRAGFQSQQAAADAIGCRRGTVGMWEAPSSNVGAIDGEYLLPVARAYKIRPESVNDDTVDDGYPWLEVADPALLSQSRSMRLDREIVRDVAAILQEQFRLLGFGPYQIAKYPELFEQLYERGATIDSDVRSPDNVALLDRAIKRLGLKRNGEDERGSTLPTTAVSKGNIGS